MEGGGPHCRTVLKLKETQERSEAAGKWFCSAAEPDKVWGYRSEDYSVLFSQARSFYPKVKFSVCLIQNDCP